MSTPSLRANDIKFPDGQNTYRAYDVKAPEYGAKGDGSTDDTTAIAAAITAATANGGTVYLPPGIYKTSGLTVPNGVSLVGANPKLSILITSADNVTLITSNGGGGFNQGITIRDLGLKTGNVAFTNVTGINFTKVQFSTIDNVYAESLTWIAKCDNCESVSFDKIKTFTINNGLYFIRSVNCVVSDTSMFGTSPATGFGVQVDSDCDGLELSSVNLDHCGFQILNSTTGIAHQPLSTILVDVQVGAFQGDSGFDIQAGSGLQLSNCWSGTNAGYGYHIRSGAVDGVLMSNCRALANTKHGIFAEAGGWAWIGGHVVNNSASASNTWDGFNVAASLNNWVIDGAIIGSYGNWANTQRYGINVGASCDKFAIGGNSYGGTQTANTSITTPGSSAVIEVQGVWTNPVQASTVDTPSAGTLSLGGTQATLISAKSAAADGASAVAAASDTTTTWANATAKLHSFRNNGSEKAFVRFDGLIQTASSVLIGPGFGVDCSSSGSCNVGTGSASTSTAIGRNGNALNLLGLVQGGIAAKANNTIASNTTIAPTGLVTHITGTTTIQTITAPASFAQTNGGGVLFLVFDGVAPWNAAGNIFVAGTPTTAGTVVMFVYDNATSKWYPSRLT